MDDDVLAAMARWPDVPAVCGWLSLDPRGRWRLHPVGDAAAGAAGEPITNPRILAFMDRNYTHDDTGRWFFQNGPQRVYVRVDAAPLILRVASEQPGLVTHTGAAVREVSAWYADETGHLYAQTDLGPGQVEDRDLAAVMDAMRLPDGAPLLETPPSWLQSEGNGGASIDSVPSTVTYAPYPAAPLSPLRQADAGNMLGFVANPTTPA